MDFSSDEDLGSESEKSYLESQAEFHKANGTYPGESWKWRTNGGHKDRKRYVREMEKKHGKGNVLIVDAAFTLEGKRLGETDFSLWVRA